MLLWITFLALVLLAFGVYHFNTVRALKVQNQFLTDDVQELTKQIEMAVEEEEKVEKLGNELEQIWMQEPGYHAETYDAAFDAPPQPYIPGDKKGLTPEQQAKVDATINEFKPVNIEHYGIIKPDTEIKTVTKTVKLADWDDRMNSILAGELNEKSSQ